MGVSYASGWVGSRWQNAALAYAMPPASMSVLYGVNTARVAVGRQLVSTSPSAGIVAKGGAVFNVSDDVGPDALLTEVNNAGMGCGWNLQSGRGFLYDVNSMTVARWIDPFVGDEPISLFAVNAAGHVAGLSGHRAFVGGSSLTDLGPAGFVSDLNDSDVVCGSVEASGPAGFLPAAWTPGQSGARAIPLPGGFVGGHAAAVNNQGDIVGTCWRGGLMDRTQSAFIHRSDATVDLNTLLNAPGWHIEFANDINDAGQIVGSGSYQGGPRTGILLTPVPTSPTVVPPHLPDLIGWLLGGVAVDGGGGLVTGGHRHPVGPWGLLAADRNPDRRDAIIALLMDAIASEIDDASTRARLHETLRGAAREHLERLGAGSPAPAQRSIDVAALVEGLPATSPLRLARVSR